MYSGLLKEILKKTLIATSAMVFAVTFHEFMHFVIGKALSLPMFFSSLTSVNIANAEQFSFYKVWITNSLPVFLSTILLGFAPVIIYKRTRSYFLKWCIAFNIPYFGLQMMVATAPIIIDGNGNDMSLFLSLFHVNLFFRSIIGVIGFVVFLLSIKYVSSVLYKDNYYNANFNRRTNFVLALFIVPLLSVSYGNYLQSIHMNGIYYIFYGGLVSTSIIFFAMLILGKIYRCLPDWVIPGTISLLILYLFGKIGKPNDYLSFWIFMGPIVLGLPIFTALNPKIFSHRS